MAVLKTLPNFLKTKRIKIKYFIQRRNQKFAKGGARLQKKFLTMANSFQAL